MKNFVTVILLACLLIVSQLAPAQLPKRQRLRKLKE